MMAEEKKEIVRAKSIALPEPVKFADSVHSSIELREPNGGQFSEFIAKSQTMTGWDAGMHLVSLVSGTPPGALKLMPTSAVDEAIDFVLGFTKRGKEMTGSD